MIAYAAGRQIAIPLSGGYDSRLIATMLKKLGYENVIAFTYGVPGNKDSEISKTTAEKLGVPWHFVEYSNERWRAWFESTERKDYYRMGSGWASLAHTQDWPAVWELTERGVLDPDAVIVPGHGAMAILSHLKFFETHSHGMSADLLAKVIRKTKYNLRPFPKEPYNVQLFLRIKEQSIAICKNIPPDTPSAFTFWEWQERQAKFLANAVRVYDFWGYDWWMPLWDAEFMRFWQGVPLELRLNKRWYAGYVVEAYSESAGVPVQDAGSTERSRKMSGLGNWQKYLSDSVKKSNVLRFFSAQVLLQLRLRQAQKHPFATFGKFPASLLVSSLKAGIGLNGINAICLLSFLTSELKDSDGFGANSCE